MSFDSISLGEPSRSTMIGATPVAASFVIVRCSTIENRTLKIVSRGFFYRCSRRIGGNFLNNRVQKRRRPTKSSVQFERSRLTSRVALLCRSLPLVLLISLLERIDSLLCLRNPSRTFFLRSFRRFSVFDRRN